MKPEPSSQQDIDINLSHSSLKKGFETNSQIHSGSHTIPSRKCTVLDLLFDREVCFLNITIKSFGEIHGYQTSLELL